MRSGTRGNWRLTLGRLEKARCGPDAGGEGVPFSGYPAEVAFHLKSVPELVGLAKEDAEPDRHGRCNGSPAVDYLIDRARGDSDGPGHRVLRNAHRLEVFLKQDLAGGNVVKHVQEVISTIPRVYHTL